MFKRTLSFMALGPAAALALASTLAFSAAPAADFPAGTFADKQAP